MNQCDCRYSARHRREGPLAVRMGRLERIEATFTDERGNIACTFCRQKLGRVAWVVRTAAGFVGTTPLDHPLLRDDLPQDAALRYTDRTVAEKVAARLKGEIVEVAS